MNLLSRLKYALSQERRYAAEVVSLLVEVESAMLFAELGYSSMFDFIVRELGLSESSAYRRLCAMKLLKENPAVAEKLQSGELSLTNASRIMTIFNAAKKQQVELPKAEVFEAALNASSREAEKKFAAIAVQTGLELKSQDSFREEINVVKVLYSHQHPSLSDHELLVILAKEKLAAPLPCDTGRGKTESDSRYIPARVKRAVQARVRSCTYVDANSGRRCCGTHFLEYHTRCGVCLRWKNDRGESYPSLPGA